MKILYLINQYPKVSHTFIRREIQALEKQGVGVNRLAMRSDNPDQMSEIDKAEYAKTHYVLKVGAIGLVRDLIGSVISSPKTFYSTFKVMWTMYLASRQGLHKHLIYIIESANVAKHCKQHNIEHIHAHFGTNPAEVAMYTSLLSGIPYSFTVHGPEEFDKPLTLNLKEKIHHASMVVAITHFCKSQLFRWAAFEDWHKVKIVHCGLEDTFFHIEKTESVQVNQQLRFLCIGRLCEQKGQLLLLQAFKNCLQQGLVAHLTFAGDGEMREIVESYISQHKLKDSVTISGWVDSNAIKSMLKQSDAMVLPSFAEGLPVAIMEAMATGVPVISTAIAGIPELIIDGETGFLVNAGSVEQLEKALLQFSLLSFEQLHKIKEAAFTAVKAAHHIDNEAMLLRNFIAESKT